MSTQLKYDFTRRRIRIADHSCKPDDAALIVAYADQVCGLSATRHDWK